MVACVRISFLFKAERYSTVRIHHILFTHSSDDGQLGCFYPLAIVNNAVMSISVEASVLILVFNSFGYMYRNRVTRSYGDSTFNFLRNCYCTILHYYQQSKTVPLFPYLPILVGNLCPLLGEMSSQALSLFLSWVNSFLYTLCLEQNHQNGKKSDKKLH